MHILFITAWYPGKHDSYDGVFVREHALAVSKYVEVSLIHLTFKKGFSFKPIVVKKSIFEGIQEYRIKITFPIRRFGLYEYLIKWAYNKVIESISNKKKIDICHLNIKFPTTDVVPNLQTLKNIPIVFAEHFSYYHNAFNQLPTSEKEAKREEISNWLNQSKINRILPVSNQLKNVFVEEFKVDINKVLVLPNVASNTFKYIEGVMKNENKFTILLAARWQHPKNPFLFIEVLEKLPNDYRNRLSINWVGEGKQYPKIKKALSMLDVKVNYFGFLPKEKIAVLMQGSDLFVHPTDKENLPCVIIESLCCGLPVLSCNVNGIPELINNSNGRMYKLKDVISFTENLLWMIENINSFDRKRISEEALQKYSLNSVGKQITQVYEEVLDEKS